MSYHLSSADPSTGVLPADAPNTNGSVDAGVWTGGSPTAKGYVAALPVTWLTNVHNNNENMVVSTADALTKAAAKGIAVNPGYTLSSYNNKWTAGLGNSSWGAALDYGINQY